MIPPQALSESTGSEAESSELGAKEAVLDNLVESTINSSPEEAIAIKPKKMDSWQKQLSDENKIWS